MAMTFTQTDSTTGLCGNCTGSIGGRRAASGETVGSTPVSVSVPGSSTGRLEFICIIPSGTTGDSGSWTIRLNVTTANMNLTLSGINTGSGDVVRVNSSCVDQQDIVSSSAAWDNTSIGTTGVKSVTVSCSATTVSAGDKVRICIVITNGAMTSQSFSFTPNQNIDSPFTAPANVTTTPGAGAVAYTGQTPVPFVLNPVTTSPGAGAIAYAGQAPTLAESFFTRPDAGAVTYSGQAPTEVVTQNVFTSPSAGSVTYAGQAPTEVVTANQFSSPGAGAVAYSGQTPSVTVSQIVQPAAGAIIYSGQAPTESVTANQFTSPSAGAIVYAGQQPVANTGASQTTQPGSGSIAYAGLAPLLAVTADQITVPGAGSYTYSGLAPTEIVSGEQPPEPAPAPSGGGYYRYFSVDEMGSCKREIKALEKRQKTLEKKIAKLEVKVDDQRDRIEFARNMATINALIRQLEELERQLEIARRKLAEAEDEEMMLIALVCEEYEQRLN